DLAFPIGQGQTISQPYTLAFQTMLLQIQKRDKVLEVGTGSGYQAAILAALGGRVFTLERQVALYEKTQLLLQKLGIYGVRCYLRDGYKGLPELAPFDKILVTAGATELPTTLRSQLSIGGKMIVPIGVNTQEMYVIERLSKEEFRTTTHGHFRFVPFLKGITSDE
ncbi:MAG: protein-L-isoaspartate O-methyltransferase, partial [Bacteroidota bacterium]